MFCVADLECLPGRRNFCSGPFGDILLCRVMSVVPRTAAELGHASSSPYEGWTSPLNMQSKGAIVAGQPGIRTQLACDAGESPTEPVCGSKRPMQARSAMAIAGVITEGICLFL